MAEGGPGSPPSASREVPVAPRWYDAVIMQGTLRTPSRSWPGAGWLGGLLVAASGVWVFHRALNYFFSADDFPALARAAGLLPRLQGPWRLLSGQLYFDLLRPVAGLDPHGYHGASLLLHAACSAALFVLLRRRLSTPAALAGAAFFATHPSHYAAAYWVSAAGAPLALLASLGALAATLQAGRARWLAVPLFAAALLARESVLLLPLAMWAALGGEPRLRSGRGAARTWRDPLLVTLAALALAMAACLAATDVMGTRSGPGAYRLDFGSALVANLASYLGWSANFLLPTVRRFQDAADPLAFGWGAGLLALWLAGLASPGLRSRGWAAAGALYLALLAPALPLAHHTYHYYLYGPLAGLAWCVAAALDLLMERLRPGSGPAGPGGRARPSRRPTRGADTDLRAWALALGAVVLLTVNASLLVRKIETTPFPGSPALRADPTVDRALIARNAVEGLQGAALAEHTRLLFWSPIGQSFAGSSGESYFERNVRTALFEGLAVRVFLPAVDSVRFVSAYRSMPAPYRYAVYRPDGTLRVASSAELDSVLAGSTPAR